MNFPDLGATGIIGIAIIAFAAIGFVKGLVRTVSAMICLGVAGYSALWAYENASDLIGPWIASPGPWFPVIIALSSGIFVFFMCRFILRFLVDPFNSSKAGKRIGFGLPAAALSFCSGLAILWLAFTGIRYGGSLAEIRYTQHKIILEDQKDTSRAEQYAMPLLLRAKQALSGSSIGKWHRQTDPFYTPQKVKLCTIIVFYHHTETRTRMLNNPALNELLNQPAFLEVAYQENVLREASSGNPSGLFSDASIDDLLTNPETLQLLENINPQDMNILTQYPHSDQHNTRGIPVKT